MLRLPNNSVQKALMTILQEKLANRNVSIYDFVPENAFPPYVTLGSTTTEDISTKTEDQYRMSQQINIWSWYEGKHEINRIAEYIINLLTSNEGHLDLSEEGFFVWKQVITLYEAYPEENTGYNGVINLELFIQTIETKRSDK